jgi:hypothetical protein
MTSTMTPTTETSTALPRPNAGRRVGTRFGGAFVTRSLFDTATIARLAEEAAAARPTADFQETLLDDLADRRGGQPARRLWTAQGGPVQDAAYADADVALKLSKVAGRPIAPAGNRGSYSFYVDDRHFLGLHRDIPTCDVSVITVLFDDSDPTDPAGGLLCYPDRCHEPLSAIRATPRDGARLVKPRAGETVVIAGGEVAHRVLPTAPGTSRVISVLCFRAA